MESRKSKKIPAFFKPFIAEGREQRMLIPPFFKHFMEDRMPSSAFIRDCNEKLWHVEVSQRGDKFFFEDGWSNFVQEKNIQRGDCLVFEYDGESFFDVKLFGDTSCEKEFSAAVFEAQVKEKEMEEEDEDEEDEDRENEEEEEEEVKVANKRKRSCRKVKTSGGGVGNNARSTRVLEDEAIFDLGIVNRPKNPYFVAKLHPNRMSDMRVPTYVVNDFNLKFPEKIDICDEDGRTWKADVKEWHDGRICIKKGWKSFLRWNVVKPNDKCLCEFVRENVGSTIRLKIRIVRATSMVQ